MSEAEKALVNFQNSSDRLKFLIFKNFGNGPFDQIPCMPVMKKCGRLQLYKDNKIFPNDNIFLTKFWLLLYNSISLEG